MTADNNHLLDPTASPATMGTGTRRVNNLPLMLAGGGIMAFAVIIAVVASGRSQQQVIANRDNGVQKTGQSALVVGRQIAGNMSSGVVEKKAPPAPPPVPVLPSEPPHVDQPTPPTAAITIQRPDNLDIPPPPPPPVTTGGTGADDKLSEAENAMAQAKLSQFTQAVQAHTTVALTMSRSSGSRPSAAGAAEENSVQAKLVALRERINHADDQSDNGAADRTSAELARVRAQVKKIEDSPNGEASSGSATQGATGDNESSNAVGKFDGKPTRWRLDSSIEAPETPYELRTGNILPATLISGINSELPGQIQAQVSQNVYDTATGRYLLIPQGSKLVGQYNSQIAYGQSRVLVAWQRIIFPDGKALDIGAMPGADFAGYAGLKDQVDNHYVRIFGSALLMSGIMAGVNYTQNQSQGSAYGYNMNSTSVLSQSLGQGMGQAMEQLMQRNMNISPTLTIRPGFRLNVLVTKDLVFSKPYQNFDY